MISSEVNLSWISPYQTKGGVNRESVFFGRDQILNHILNRNPANYFLAGARQIGKSTILKAIERRSKKTEGIECFYIALAGENLIQRMAYALKLENANIEDIISHLRELSENQTLFFLIDESDKFVESDSRTGYKVLNQLRGLSEEGKCFFILAGFWTLYRYAIFDYQSPIKNFGETLQIGALEPDACRELATVPMEHLNIKYESEVLADKIIKETGQRANLIAIVCNELIKNTDLKHRVITEKDIQNALLGKAVLNFLGGWGHMSEDDEKANQLDRFIICTGVGIEPFSQKDIMQALNDNQFPFNPEEIREALIRLELAFILEQQQMMYSFRVPVFKKMIQKLEPECMLDMEMHSIL